MHPLRVIVEIAETYIASDAQHAPDLFGSVAVIHSKPIGRTTDFAHFPVPEFGSLGHRQPVAAD
ncbi:hypothetical protein AX767_00370 [Variovorax sp. PAMC 28711]|nr:hypothetical protein [Variovorax sp. PAMC 28711]AMM23005.1 hypothetical protein AX767_00370 [Variovorax sp. PAMC 28711]